MSASGAGRLLDAARRRRMGIGDTPEHSRVYPAMTAALGALLGEVGPTEWARIAAYEEWTVQDLVAHLTATDGLLAHQLGVPVWPPVRPEDDVASRTELLLANERARTPAHTWTAWRAQAQALCHWLAEHPGAEQRSVTVGPMSMPVSDMMTVRAFETWIHTGDISAALNRSMPRPPEEHLHRMADLGAHLLPVAAACHQVEHRGRSLRLVLSGPGGGTWLVPLDPRPSLRPTEEPAVELVLDVVDFCLLLGDRRPPATIQVTLSGDAVLGHQVLDAAPSLAVR
ncbi:MAG: maleylpyruvate isomerase family mycothiol-dependent enzyme [Pseudonocardiaceae bacterium]